MECGTESSDSADPPALEAKAVDRSFGPVQALSGVSISVRQGEVLGLAGENGAGKSTLLNILCGIDQPDSGEVLVRGQRVSHNGYYEAACNGIYRVFQELAILGNMTIWENLFLGHERQLMRAGVIDRQRAISTAQDVFERMGHGWIDVERRADDYPFAVRQVVEILKAFALAEILGWTNPILLLDEPTAALGSEEVEFLRTLIEKVRSRSAVILVSHRLSEVLDWSDRVTVLKDGRVTGGGASADLSEADLHYMMVGRARDVSFYRESRQREPEPEPLLTLEGYGDGTTFQGVNLKVRRGEIVGVAGVLGAGKTELGEAIYGARQSTAGLLTYRGKPLSRPTIRDMVRAGVGYVSPERKHDGLLDTFSVTRNITFARITAQAGQFLNLKKEAEEGRSYVSRLRIKTPSPDASVLALSGGNQQKVVLARWLARGIDLLILDNPTRGVDAGAKEEIYDLMRELVDAGAGILLISDDLLEIIGLSNRVVVLKGGVVTTELDASPDDKPSEAELVASMV